MKVLSADPELHESGRPAEQMKKLQDEVDRLRSETAKLRERLDRLDAKAPAATPPPSSSGPTSGGDKPPAKARRSRPVARRAGRSHRPVRRSPLRFFPPNFLEEPAADDLIVRRKIISSHMTFAIGIRHLRP